MCRRIDTAVFLVLAVNGSGCLSPPPYAIITVEDEFGLAGGALAITFGTDLSDMRRIRVESDATFPMTFAARAERERKVGMWVDALDVEGLRLARGFAPDVEFSAESAGVATVQLLPACDTAEEKTRCLRERGDLGYCLNGVCSGPIWTQLDGEPNAASMAIAVDSADNIFVAGVEGWVEDVGVGWVAKYDAGGTMVASVNLGSGPMANATGIAVDSSGDVIVVGFDNHSVDLDGEGIGKIWKYDNDLSRLAWEVDWDEPGSGTEWIVRAAVDEHDNIYVVGMVSSVKIAFRRFDDGAQADARLNKYDSSGQPVWSSPVEIASHTVWDLALDSHGNIVVVGEALVAGSDMDVWVYQYDADASLLWSTSYDGLSRAADYVTGVDIDANDDIYVSGIDSLFPGPETSGEALLLKLDSAGQLLWCRRYDGLANGEDMAWGVAVDESGNPVVVGHTESSSHDAWLRKYGPGGEVLWTQTYDGEFGFYSDQAMDVAITRSGSIAVAGASNRHNATLTSWVALYGP